MKNLTRLTLIMLSLALLACSPVDSLKVFDDKQAAKLVKNTYLKNKP